ncbi:hypothetical protein PISMIDRAFT_680858 [Pisolithus microcarpus 441]|uniref:Uncharacterized protein n=1 Tax=Pisolithus microcarpus 441 TaxID=765257 RepID=A0A0C9ZHD9_9AGAM|nr:hypothetical protein PISMIDRAFT_680858 [Pisolithus microcarpus 441]
MNIIKRFRNQVMGRANGGKTTICNSTDKPHPGNSTTDAEPIGRLLPERVHRPITHLIGKRIWSTSSSVPMQVP